MESSPLIPEPPRREDGRGRPGRLGEPSSTVSFGFSVPVLLGVTCLRGIPDTKPATDDFSNGCAPASCVVFSRHWLETCRCKGALMCAKPSSRAALQIGR